MYNDLPLHKVFISYHHFNDQYYKDELVRYFGDRVFIDMSVDTGDIDDNLPDESIRRIIRDDYLRDSSVTIVLVGTETWKRKHVDWEIYSSMFDGAVNKKSGILVINLPTIFGAQLSTSDDEQEILGPELIWTPTTSYDQYSYLPARLFENIKSGDVRITIVDYERIINNPMGLYKLIDNAYNNKRTNKYNLSTPMRRRNG